MKVVDAHCHVHAQQFAEDRDAVIVRMNENGIFGVLAGDTLAESANAVELATTHDCFAAVIGVHPNEAGKELLDEDAFGALLASPKVVGVGEIGLDYARLTDMPAQHKQQQWDLLTSQLQFAQRHVKPVVIHCRDAYEDVLSILDDFPKLSVMMHTFVGSPEIAEKFLERGAFLSFSGIVTFPNAQTVRDAGRIVPANKLLIETDAPFLAPVPHRGKRNEPVYVLDVAKGLAETRNEDVQELLKATTENASRLFGLASFRG